MKCEGNSEDHCCYLWKKVCPFLKEYKDGPRRWSCGLYEQYGSWESVHASKEYIAEVAPDWEKIVEWGKQFQPEEKLAKKCGDFPMPGEKCYTCGKVG